MERWASLYLVALRILGDENQAAELVLRARNEHDLAQRLSLMDSLPETMPQPTPVALEQVTALRRRAGQRRRMLLLWAGALAVLVPLVLGAALVARSQTQAQNLAAYWGPPQAEAEAGGLTLRVHGAKTGPDGMQVWWSLEGDGAGSVHLETTAFEFGVGLEHSGHEVSHTVRSGRLLGETHFDFRQWDVGPVTLHFWNGQNRWTVTLVPDRSSLDQAEKRVPVYQVMDRHVTSVYVREIVLGPGYMVVDWEPWLSPGRTETIKNPLLLEGVRSAGGTAVAKTAETRTQAGRLTQFAAAPAGANELTLVTTAALVEPETRLLLEDGMSDPFVGIAIGRTWQEKGAVLISLDVAGDHLYLSSLLEDDQGRVFPPAGHPPERGALGGGKTLRFELPGGVNPRFLWIRTEWRIPPVTLSVPY